MLSDIFSNFYRHRREENLMPPFSLPSRRSRSVHRRRFARSGHGCIRPETLERRTMLTGNDPSLADETPSEVVVEPPALVAPIGEGLDTFASADAYTDWLVEQAVDRWQHLFGRPEYGWPWYYDDMAVGRPDFVTDAVIRRDDISVTMADGRPDSTTLEVLRAGDAFDSSATNTQIAGVDEADLVEVDGDTLYALAQGRLSVVQGFAETAPELVSQIDLTGSGRVAGMYLFGDRLTVVSRDVEMTIASRTAVGFPSTYPPVRGRAQTTVTVLDVTDPAAVTVANRTTFDGELISSRMVDGQLRLVLNHRLKLPQPQLVPIELIEDATADPVAPAHTAPDLSLGRRPAGLQWWPDIPKPNRRYESAEAYAARVREQLVETMTPQVYQVDAAGDPLDVSTLVDPTAIDIPEPGSVRQLTTVTTVDVTAARPQSITTGLFTQGEVEVFATAEEVYVFDSHFEESEPSLGLFDVMWWQPPTPVTTVTKVGFGIDQLDSPAIDLVSQGTFTGRVLNQFAADKQDVFLRVVVETPWEGSGVVVLEQQGESLVAVGSLSGLAPNENLYSVRFVGDRAYFVTFRRVDPLFVVDFSTPTAPKLLGELKVPGYSDHIQPLDENQLLTIGRDADDATGRFKGMQVSIFDVSDPASPSLLHRHTLAGGRSTSTVITGDRWRRGDGDHLALGFFPDEGVITIPVRTDGQFGWEPPIQIGLPFSEITLPGPTVLALDEPVMSTIEVGRGTEESLTLAPEPIRPKWKPPLQHLEVLSFDITGGISSLGAIDHDTSVDRAVKISGQLVGVSSSEVTVHGFTDPSTTLGSVRLDEVTIQSVDDLPATSSLPLPDIAALLDRAVAGLPVRGTWLAKAAETIGDETVVFAEHASGAVHRLTSHGPFAEEGWAAFGFEGVGNAENRPLSRSARGTSFASAVPEIQNILSEAILKRFNMERDESGQLRRKGALFAEFVNMS